VSQEGASQEDISKDDSDKIKKKFLALFLFVIGFVLTLIFAKAGNGERTVALLSIIVHIMTLAEGIIAKMNKDSGASQFMINALYVQNNDSQFNFDNEQTRVTYAKAKFIVSIILSIVYIPLNALLLSKSEI
jgi:hypothetical protein